MKKRGEELLTDRQLTVLKLRAEGMKQAEIASRLGLTRQDISHIERSAMKNIRRALTTISVATGAGIAGKLRIPEDTHILDVGKMLLETADRCGVKLKGSVVDMLQLARTEMLESIRAGRLTEEREAVIFPDGSVHVLPNAAVRKRRRRGGGRSGRGR